LCWGAPSPSTQVDSGQCQKMHITWQGFPSPKRAPHIPFEWGGGHGHVSCVVVVDEYEYPKNKAKMLLVVWKRSITTRKILKYIVLRDLEPLNMSQCPINKHDVAILQPHRFLLTYVCFLGHLDVVNGCWWVLNVVGGGGNGGKTVDRIGHVSQFSSQFGELGGM